MQYKQLVQSYKNQGLDNDFCLRTVEDFEKVFLMNVADIEGYTTLNENQQVIFNQFLVNYLNGLGLNTKATFIPVKVFYVDEIHKCYRYAVDENGKELFTTYKVDTYKIINGKRIKMLSYSESDYTLGSDDVLKDFVSSYIRFDFKEFNRKIWLHVINGKEWY